MSFVDYSVFGLGLATLLGVGIGVSLVRWAIHLSGNKHKRKAYLEASQAFHKFRDEIVNIQIPFAELEPLRQHLLTVALNHNFCVLTERYRFMVVNGSLIANRSRVATCGTCMAFPDCMVYQALCDRVHAVSHKRYNEFVDDYRFSTVLNAVEGSQINILRVALKYLPDQHLLLLLLQLSAAFQAEEVSFWDQEEKIVRWKFLKHK